MRSPVLDHTVAASPTEWIEDDVGGATPEDDTHSLDAAALQDSTSAIWTPRLLARPMLGAKPPASDQQDVDLQSEFWAALWHKEIDSDFAPAMPAEGLDSFFNDLPRSAGMSYGKQPEPSRSTRPGGQTVSPPEPTSG